MSESSIKTYFVQAVPNGPIKIGKATDLSGRLASLQTGSPVELKLLGYVNGDLEAELHHRFRLFRLHGEWFHPDASIRQFILSEAVETDVDGIKIQSERNMFHDPYSVKLYACSGYWRAEFFAPDGRRCVRSLGNTKKISALQARRCRDDMANSLAQGKMPELTRRRHRKYGDLVGPRIFVQPNPTNW